MRRFYKDVAVEKRAAGCAILLDGKPIATPAKAPLLAPTAALAERIAAEWRKQGETIAAAAMPLTQILNTALDRVPARRRDIAGEIAAYGASDLLCYRALHPAALVELQGASWDPLLDWLAERHGARLAVMSNINIAAQDPAALARIAEAVAGFDDCRLAGLHLATGTLGSVVLALALAERRIDANTAWAASLVDELLQLEKWGGDAEAAARLGAIRADVEAAASFMDLCRAA